MELELVEHPRYGTIKAYDLFEMEQIFQSDRLQDNHPDWLKDMLWGMPWH